MFLSLVQSCNTVTFSDTGLAASLQARIVAELKIKEENEERQRRSAISPSMHHRGASNSVNSHPSIIQTPLIKSESLSSIRKFTDMPPMVNVETCDNRSSALKRTSPIVQQHPRPLKIPHYDIHESLLTGEIINSGRQSATMELMSPEINSLTSDDRNHHIRHRNDDGKYNNFIQILS